MDIINVLKSLDFWQTVGLIVSIAFTVWQAYLYRKQLQEDAYARLHEEYIAFLKFTREHPELGFSEFNEGEVSDFNSMVGGEKEKAEEILHACNVLTAVWEHAFLLRSSMSEGQWEGWQTWVGDYLRRSHIIRRGVSICVDWYDPKFVKYARQFIAEIENSLNRPPVA